MPKQRKIDEGKLYRLRNKDTGLFLGYMRDAKPSFSKRGKDWKSRKDVLDQLAAYNFNSISATTSAPKKQWPDLEIVTFQLLEVAAEPDPICDMRHVKRFIRKTQKGGDYSSVSRFVRKLAAVGTEFDFVFHAEGVHSLPAISDALVQRNPLTQYNSVSGDGDRINGETIVAVRGDTDLLYAKLQLSDHLLGTWDYKTCKPV